MAKLHVPIYERIRRDLLDRIRGGDYTLNTPFITMVELCERYGVSRVTAERAIDELVRERYLVRYRGRGTFVAPLVNQQHLPPADEVHSIGCLMSMTQSDHKSAIIRGIDQICREHDYHLLFFDSGESATSEAANVRRAVRAQVSAMIVYPVDGTNNVGVFQEIAASSLSLVMIDRFYPTIACHRVVPDNVAAGYLPTKALLEQGHRYIGTVWQEIDCTSVQERFIGYRQAIIEAQTPLITDLATMHSYYHQDADQRLALLRRWMASSYRPTAIIAANSLTLGVLATDLAKLNLRPGTDVALGSMDMDNPGVPLTLDALSTKLPSFEMGREAMRLALGDLHDNAAIKQQITLPVSLASPAGLYAGINTSSS